MCVCVCVCVCVHTYIFVCSCVFARACARASGCVQERPNVLVMTTSNITEAIDLAFVDRSLFFFPLFLRLRRYVASTLGRLPSLYSPTSCLLPLSALFLHLFTSSRPFVSSEALSAPSLPLSYISHPARRTGAQRAHMHAHANACMHAQGRHQTVHRAAVAACNLPDPSILPPRADARAHYCPRGRASSGHLSDSSTHRSHCTVCRRVSLPVFLCGKGTWFVGPCAPQTTIPRHLPFCHHCPRLRPESSN